MEINNLKAAQKICAAFIQNSQMKKRKEKKRKEKTLLSH
jgi:hypothetical protein